MLSYGLIKSQHIRDYSIAICDVLGYGKNETALELLIETANAETGGGKVKDKTTFAGMGLTQFDKMPFYDVKNRVSLSESMIIKDKFDINLSFVEWEHLRYNPFLSLLFTRLKYRRIKEEIPKNIEDRSKYWKLWYNSLAGGGSVYHYLETNNYDMSKYNKNMEV